MLAYGTRLLDRYEVEHHVGAGGMQDVYACVDHALRRRAVVKVPKQGVRDRRFRRGASAGAVVRHQNVAATFDYYEDANITFMVEELVPGRDLGKRLAADFDYLDPALAAHLLHHITRALVAAHRAGICHRDLKPSNIMVSDDAGLSVVKLTDFGIAKMAQSELGAEIHNFGRENSLLTSSSTLLGAVPYLAPECWEDWSTADRPMDIWALGCIGYQLLSGTPPFGGGPSAIGKVMRAAATGVVDLPDPSWFGAHGATAPLERDLLAIVRSCLATSPGARPTAEQVLIQTAQLCYPEAPRRHGVVQSFGVPFQTTGWIRDSDSQESYFFHKSEFYGVGRPQVGQRVSFSVYPGIPSDRVAPVLKLKFLA